MNARTVVSATYAALLTSAWWAYAAGWWLSKDSRENLLIVAMLLSIGVLVALSCWAWETWND